MGYLKGKSSQMIFDRHANLKYKYGNRQFWHRGYKEVIRNMKWVKTGLLSLLLVIVGVFSWTVSASGENGADFSVEFTIQQDTLRLELDGIPADNPRQLLSVLVIHRDADMSQPDPGDILYANALYLNGRTALTLDIDTNGRDARYYRLVISDSTGAVAYSELLGPETPDTTTSGATASPTTATGGPEATTTGSGAQGTTSSNAGQATTTASAATESTPGTPATGDAPLMGMVVLAAAGGLITVVVCRNKRRANGGAK